MPICPTTPSPPSSSTTSLSLSGFQFATHKAVEIMQQPPGMMPVNPSFSSPNITTEQIQKCLDDNKKLILAILENQNLGKLAECAQYQAQLQKNLMYLAAIADAQPQTPAMATGTQMPAPPHPTMQQGAYFMHPQAAAMAQQSPGVFPPRMSMPFGSPHQLSEQQQQHLQQQHQHAIQGQMNMRPGMPGNGMHPMQSGGVPGQSKHDASEAGPSSDAPGSSGGGRGDGSDKGN